MIPFTTNRYIQAVIGSLPILLIVSFGLAAIAYVGALKVGTTYTTHYSYLVSLAERENSTDYTFDGYYALQATDLFAATLARWATTPEVIAAAYDQAGLPPVLDVRQLLRLVAAEKTAPQLVQVTVRGNTPEQTLALTRALLTEIEHNVLVYHDEGIPALRFTVVATEPWSGQQPVAVKVITSTMFVVSLLLGINGVVFWASFK